MGESMDQGHSRDERRRKPRVEKKKLLLRIDPKLHRHLRLWAEEDFRSINAQIEFLLKKAVSNRKADFDKD
jgi:hypothetical protein